MPQIDGSGLPFLKIHISISEIFGSRLIGQRYQYQYGESIPCEQLVSWLCDIKQVLFVDLLLLDYWIFQLFLQIHPNFSCLKHLYFVLRLTHNPAGRGHLVCPSCIWAGTSTLATSWYDLKTYVFQCIFCNSFYPCFAFQYQSDPSGNYGGWKATCIGNNWNAAVSMLKQEYKVSCFGKDLQE